MNSNKSILVAQGSGLLVACSSPAEQQELTEVAAEVVQAEGDATAVLADLSAPVLPDDVEDLSNEDEDYLAQLQELAQIEPDSDTYQFLGYLAPGGLDLWVHGTAPAASVDTLLDDAGIERTIPGIEDSGHRMLLLSGDGRLYIERDNVFLERIAALPLAPEEFASEADGLLSVGQDPPLPADPSAQTAHAPSERQLSANPRAVGDTIHGTDGRTASVATAYPFRAMGVSLFRRTATSPLTYARNQGSASMIGPRQAVTVAHTFTDGSGVDTALGVAPAVRGTNYGNNTSPTWTTCSYTSKAPYGIRGVQWYYWPIGWDGDTYRYDYATIILYDCSYAPGWILFGYQTTSWLNFREMFMSGYPATYKNCTDSVFNTGKCDGFNYYQIENTNSVYTNYMYYDFDVQEGQSGAPIIHGIDGPGPYTVYGLHKGSEGPYSYGLRLDSARYSSICASLSSWTSVAGPNPSC